MKKKKAEIIAEDKEFIVKVMASTVLIVRVTAKNEEEALGMAEDQAMADINVGDLMYEACEDSVHVATDEDDQTITI